MIKRIVTVALVMVLGFDSTPVWAQVQEQVIIYKEKGVYACFPNLFKAEDGTMVVSFSTKITKSHHDSRGGQKTLISRNRGRHWRAADKKYINPVLKATDGSIHLPRVKGWRAVSATKAAALKKEGIRVDQNHGRYFYAIGAMVKTSHDGGKTWQEKPIALPKHSIVMSHNMSAYLKTKSGFRLFAIYCKLPGDPRYQVVILKSADEGKTWAVRPILPPGRKPNPALGFGETALAETDNGDIVAMMRPDPDSQGYLYSSVSRDGGDTWSAPRRTAVWGYPANLINVNGKIICSYGYRKDPKGVRVAVFTNNFVTPKKIIILRADGKGRGSDLGYPMTVYLGHGEFFTVYYFTTGDGITHIAGTRWKLSGSK